MESPAASSFSVCEQAGLDAQGKVNFLLSVEQGNLADLLQVVLDGVGCGTCRHDLLDGGVVVVGVRVDETCSGGDGALGGGVVVLFFLGTTGSAVDSSSSLALPRRVAAFLGAAFAAAGASSPAAAAAFLAAIVAARFSAGVSGAVAEDAGSSISLVVETLLLAVADTENLSYGGLWSYLGATPL